MVTLLEFLLSREDFRRSSYRARLPSLFSDFRHLKSVNPDGFNSNIHAWEDGLRQGAKERLIPGSDDTVSIYVGPSLFRSLENPGLGRPLAIGAVIVSLINVDEGVKAGRMIPTTDLKNSITGAGWRSWSQSWLSRYLQGFGFLLHPEKTADGHYVFMESVREAARRTMNHVQTQTTRAERVMPLKMFEREVSQALGLPDGVSANDFRIILAYLAFYENTVAVANEVVLIKGHEEEASAITAQDTDIASLKKLMFGLSYQIEDLTDKVRTASESARRALDTGSRLLAMRYVRSKLGYESLIEKRSAMLSQLEDAYNAIRDAMDQVQFIAAIQQGTRVLQGLNSEIGRPEDVTQFLEDLEEGKAERDEISEALAGTVDGAESGVGEEIISELDRLSSEQLAGRLESIGDHQHVGFTESRSAKERQRTSSVGMEASVMPNYGFVAADENRRLVPS